jgi:hypothetical protein
MGSPQTVIHTLTQMLQRLRPGSLHLCGHAGLMPHQEVRRSIALLGTEVSPAFHPMQLQLYAEDPVTGTWLRSWTPRCPLTLGWISMAVRSIVNFCVTWPKARVTVRGARGDITRPCSVLPGLYNLLHTVEYAESMAPWSSTVMGDFTVQISHQ